MKAIAIIPARGGSVRIPNKNIRMFHGKPIIAYSIKAAQDSGLFDDIVVSTDSMEIAVVAERYGATVFMRDPDDGVRGTQEVAKEVLDALDHDGECCLIYATAPMLTSDTLIDAYEFMATTWAPYVISMAEWPIDPGQFYMGLSSEFRGEVGLECAHLFSIDPRTAIDINTPEDWDQAERMYAELHKGEA